MGEGGWGGEACGSPFKTWRNSCFRGRLRDPLTADPDEATMDERVCLRKKASPFDSGTLDAEATYEHTFDVPGTYR